jgi:hypothetical protein
VKKILFFVLTVFVALAVVGCKDRSTQQVQPAVQPTQQTAQVMTGTVLETMNAGGYTYVQVDTGSETIWAASPEFAVQAGDAVIIPEGMPMVNHRSNTLDRTFDLVYFVDGVMVAGSQEVGGVPRMPEGHPPIGDRAASNNVDLSGVSKVEGGQTVEEIMVGKEKLNGKEVKLRGKVVKFNAGIMGKNWLHIQDGTGGEGANDLTVTTSDAAQVGDTVLVSGVIATNKDFGFGYQYDVIIEDARVIIE